MRIYVGEIRSIVEWAAEAAAARVDGRATGGGGDFCLRSVAPVRVALLAGRQWGSCPVRGDRRTARVARSRYWRGVCLSAVFCCCLLLSAVLHWFTAFFSFRSCVPSALRHRHSFGFRNCSIGQVPGSHAKHSFKWVPLITLLLNNLHTRPQPTKTN